MEQVVTMSLNMFLLMLCLKTEHALRMEGSLVWELKEVGLNLCSTFAQ